MKNKYQQTGGLTAAEAERLSLIAEELKAELNAANQTVSTLAVAALKRFRS